MNITENIKEGLRAIRSNTLRTILTALIIAIGITALVGILTAIDGIQASVDSNLADLGANSFEINKKGQGGGRRRQGGKAEKVYPEITYKEALAYKDLFQKASQISVSTDVSFNAEVKHGSISTNPNSQVTGIDENYLQSKGFNLSKGRGFSTTELKYGVPVAIIGQELGDKLFPKISPINNFVQVLGARYMVVGIIESSGGGLGGNGSNRSVLIPLENANQLGAGQTLTYNITTISKGGDIDNVMGEATGVMRLVRHDKTGQPNSFEISKSESLASAMDSITGSLRGAGFGIGFITLLGAAIGLMNIMLVSVTERTKEIGVRKALGATPARIRQQFLVEAVVICLLGGLGGIVLGILIGNAVSSLTGASGFIVPWLWIMVGLVVCVAVGILSGYYPAYKASKMDPIESLRFE
ncbi:putative ABC transport system permease protein [Flexibacter flexilis DSM 6793]|uniref:Putative ABC transport system permease protein n=1 Tax=Flexibacter flexilis DSM 6793 TaxID=927664 RepID=A0A1I1DEK7_9BACT|nr:ABC transporter permease [Flexibacter flexilis]SFB73244.1 putative ABC transport system permease protein [Flexibacter flexilis DSM 6793]